MSQYLEGDSIELDNAPEKDISPSITDKKNYGIESKPVINEGPQTHFENADENIN